MAEETVWRRLTRLFRSGPVVRHKIAGGEKIQEPQGTAKAFKKELSSLYVRALASYANYERLSRYSDYNEMEYTPELHTALDIYCLAGDSRVLMADGTQTISALFEQSRTDFWVYSFDPTTNRFVPGLCRKVMKTGLDCQVFKVNLDNGNFVRLTGEHLVLLFDGSYRAVSDLMPGDHIRSLYRKFSSKENGDWIDGYEKILQPNGKWQYSHRLVAEQFGSGQVGDVVHHVDFNKLNNNPSNLLFMSKEDHKQTHLRNNSDRWKNDPQFVTRMTAKFSAHARKMHALPGWTKDVFLKSRDAVFASYTAVERREKFGRRGEQNGQFGRGDLHLGPLNGRFNKEIRRSFSSEELTRLMDEGLTIREASRSLSTLVSVIRSEMRRLGITRWAAKRKPRTVTNQEMLLSLKREAHSIGDSARRLFGEICSRIGVERGEAYLQLKLAGYKNWGDFIQQTNHIVLSIVEDGRCDVFDLEVEGLHNFAVSGRDGDDFVIVHNSDEATVKSDEGNVIEVTSPNAEIKDLLETLFFDVIDVNFNAWSWMRHFCKFGDFVLFVDADEGHGILNLIPIPINEIEREEGYDPKDPMAVRFRWLTRGNTILENWQVIHFRLLGNDAYLPYGSSVLEPARRIWRQLILIEDAMLVYRIVRSPERRVFHIEIANTPPDQVDAFMEQVRTQLKRNTIVDPETGRVDLRYNPLSVEEDYILPKRGEQKSEISTLAGGQFTGDIEDVQYIQSKMFAAIKIPRAYLGYEDQLGSKATLAQEDVRFAKTIERIQGLFVSELNKIAIIHLFLVGYQGADLVNFTISMANPSTIAAQQRLELWRMKLEVAGMAQEGVFDRGFIYRKIFGLNDKQIAAIKDGKRIDKLEDTLLMSIEQPPAPEGAPGEVPPPDEGAAPGAEELPDTLGGPEPAAPATGPENASRRRRGRVIRERRNPGSTGSRAEIAVDRGKDLFSTGEDQLRLSFGTEKQTASDPNDRRAARRMVTRPFSEEPELEMPGMEQVDEVADLLARYAALVSPRGKA